MGLVNNHCECKGDQKLKSNYRDKDRGVRVWWCEGDPWYEMYASLLRSCCDLTEDTARHKLPNYQSSIVAQTSSDVESFQNHSWGTNLQLSLMKREPGCLYCVENLRRIRARRVIVDLVNTAINRHTPG